MIPVVQNVIRTLLAHTFMFSEGAPLCLASGQRCTVASKMGFPIPMNLPLLLFMDDSSLSTNTRLTRRNIIFAGLTAVKKSIIHSWISPDPPSAKEWLNHFGDIALLERSLAVIHKTRASTVKAWDALITSLSDITLLACNKGLLCCYLIL